MWVVVYKNVGLLANMHVKLRELGKDWKKMCVSTAKWLQLSKLYDTDTSLLLAELHNHSINNQH